MAVRLQLQSADVSLRVRLIVAGAAGCLLLIGVGLVARDWLAPGVWYPWKAAALFAALVATALAFVGQHPFPRLGPANRLTLVRAMLVALTAALIGEAPTPRVAAAAIVATAVITVLDGVDGWLARRSRMGSAFGARFDMETDALLVMVMSALVWTHGKAAVWILACGLLRYAFVAAGWVLPWMAGPLSPTHRAKTIAIASLVGLSVALAPFVPPPVSGIVAAVTLASLAWSFGVDVRRLWRQRVYKPT